MPGNPVISSQPTTPGPVVLDTVEIAAFIMGGAMLGMAVDACCQCVTCGYKIVEAYKAEKAKKNG